MRKLNVGVDLDGVCYDFTGSLRHYLVEHQGFDPERVAGGGYDAEESCWDFYKKYWDMSTAEFLKWCDMGVDDGVIFLHGEPFEDTVETLTSIRDKGHAIHVVTNRSFGTRSHHNTSDWLERHGIPFDSLIFASDKRIIRPDIFVDDYENNFYELNGAGIETWLYTRPWNIHVDTPYRVDNWNEFEAAVDRMAEL